MAGSSGGALGVRPHAARPSNTTPRTTPRSAPRTLRRSGRAQPPAPAPRAVAAAPAPALAPPAVRSFDFLVIGSGIAGLTYALKVAEHGSVAVITKAAADEGCTRYAQGGICAVLDAHDSVEAHVADTMVAGAHLSDRRAVEVVCREGPGYVLELARLGAQFTLREDAAALRAAHATAGVSAWPGAALHLTREGGHSARRIVHAADATGAEIERALLAAVRAHPAIQIFEHQLSLDLLTGEAAGGVRYALGADALDTRSGAVTRFVAPVTMLASGGAGQVYPLTTNPGVSTGDGMAMAYRARAALSNLEFVQFHPTALVSAACPTPAGSTADGRAFLVSEAVRGEGGRLLDASGRRFMPGYDSRAELAPRDVVARAIQAEMAAASAGHVLLDCSHLRRDDVLRHFPTIAAECARLGLDMAAEPVPVAPAQHYMCGGVSAGLHGETSLPGLFACGEVASSGLHGANRLASNSLLEGLVFANRAVGASVAHAAHAASAAAGALRAAAAGAGLARAAVSLPPGAAAWVAGRRRRLAELMWSAAGIVRRQADMKAAMSEIAGMYEETKAMAEAHGPSTEMAELRNLVTVGALVMSSALQRRESRGGHYCVDFPEALPLGLAASTVVSKASMRKRLDVARPGAAAAQPFGSAKRALRPRELAVTRSAEE